jgi:hypothetical protein
MKVFSRSRMAIGRVHGNILDIRKSEHLNDLRIELAKVKTCKKTSLIIMDRGW